MLLKVGLSTFNSLEVIR